MTAFAQPTEGETPIGGGAILAISGSLRRSSVNSAALRAAAAAAASYGVPLQIDGSIPELPHFDPDLEHEPPPAVLRFRAACERATAVLLAVPEYAHGIPGAFKNALDWTVGSGSLYRKPVAVLGVAHPGRGAHVRRALDAVLEVLDADVSHHSVPVAPSARDARGEIADAAVVAALAAVVGELAVRAAGARRC